VIRIDRAAWKRIKARMAEPRTDNLPPYLKELLQFADGNRLEASGPRAVSFRKGCSVGPTVGILEQMADLYDVAPQRPGETAEHFKQRCARRLQSLTRDTTGAEVET